jgi:hypothetical protein
VTIDGVRKVIWSCFCRESAVGKKQTILLVAIFLATVFGLTYITQYNRDSGETDTPGSGDGPKASTSKEVPLRFSMTRIDAKEPPSFMKWWDSGVEVGGTSHVEFWCRNQNPKPVSIKIPSLSCQCGSADFGAIPNETMRDYAALSVLSTGPFSVSPAIFSAYTHALLNSKITWVPLKSVSVSDETSMQAAEAGKGPAYGIVRLNWTGKDPTGPKTLSIDAVAALPGASGLPQMQRLEAAIDVLPGFEVIRRMGPGAWKPVTDLPVGEIRERGTAKGDLYCASYTRESLAISTLFGAPREEDEPCITWTRAVAASAEEFNDFREFIGNEKNGKRKLKCLYKMTVTVNERVEIDRDGQKVLRQLELGPIDRKLKIMAAQASERFVDIGGRVIGDISVLVGAELGRIDLGNSFTPDQDHTRDLTLVAERPGLDVKLLDAETFPTYLRVKLEPLPDVSGRKQWRLRVTVPKGKLYGALPASSVIVLQTNDPQPRRVRLPVRGMTYDTGKDSPF